MDARRIVAVIKPFKLDAVVQALGPFLVGEIEVSEARGYGRQKGHLELYAGKEYELNFLPKVRIELAVKAENAPAAVGAIVEAARTGRIGDGKVFVLPAREVVPTEGSE